MSEMTQNIITVDDARCIGCNACVRACPVHAISTKLKEGTMDQFVSSVISERCIKCGECVKVCKHEARGYMDDSAKFFENLEGKPMYIIVAPSIKTAFSNWNGILNWLKGLGHRVYDVSFGADICTWAHAKLIESDSKAKIISQPCPAVVNCVTKYHPSLVPFLSRIHSPASCLALYLKKYQSVREPIWLLSPCIAKTDEARKANTFEYNVTFENLDNYISRKNLRFKDDADFEFTGMEGVLGTLYPRPGGLRDNLLAINPNLVVSTAEGSDLYDRLLRYSATKYESRPDVFDCLNCKHGCNQGTASTLNDIVSIESEMTALELKANSARGHFLRKDKNYKEFSKNLDWQNFTTSYVSSSIVLMMPTRQQADDIFNEMLKTTPESRCIDCGACGYSSCSEMCDAIFRKDSVKENCVYYMKQLIHQQLEEHKKVLSMGDISDGVSQLSSLVDVLSSDEAFQSSIDLVNQLIKLFNNYKEANLENGETEEENENVQFATQVLKILNHLQRSLEKTRDAAAIQAITQKIDELKKLF